MGPPWFGSPITERKSLPVMHTHRHHPTPTTNTARIVALGVLTVALAAATMLAPWLLTGPGPDGMATAFGSAFAHFWKSGSSTPPVDLTALVDDWRRFHIAKSVIGLALLVVACRLTIALYRGTSEPTRRRPLRALPAAAVAAIALVIVAANIQGAIAPLSSLLPFLSGSGDPTTLAIASQAHTELMASVDGSFTAPLQVLVDDFARYHTVFAVIAGVLTVGVLGATGVALRAAAVARRGARTRPLACAAALTVVALTTGVVCAANISSAAESAQALAVFFGG
ncbi:putative membrane protein [Gordonia polyisoprenivorans VH2]|uniref:Putative membrane protein n=2 Tax=Gordonia polyisoprenivorans TaxID=84595 RepID=H6N3F2_GORPV|nr:putative membrane protein [Gordonia polyisoprenivorans VH2]